MNWFPPCRIVAHKHMVCQQQGLTPALRALLTHHALICLVAIKAENPKYEHVQTLSTEAPFMHYFFGEHRGLMWYNKQVEYADYILLFLLNQGE